MRHKIDIWSKQKNGFSQIEDHIIIDEDEICAFAVQQWKLNHSEDPEKEYSALIDSTIHD